MLRRTIVVATTLVAALLPIGEHAEATVQTVTAATTGSIASENAKSGTTAWHLTFPGGISGWADATSAQAGNIVHLHVSYPAARSFHVEAYRMGYYGGAGGRLVWTSTSVIGTAQHAGTVDSGSRMVETQWPVSTSFGIDASWVPGSYLLKLVGDHAESYIPLVIRDASSHSDLAVVLSTMTYEAYNGWGGYSLYYGPSGGAKDRSYKVSFDRPYATDNGAGNFLEFDYPLIRLIESAGLDATYITDNDLDANPASLSNHRALVTLGHDEYWTASMRDGATTARDSGVNLAFFGGNDVYWQARTEPSPTGPGRHMIVYRDATVDPVGPNDPTATVLWRQKPVSRPEASLVGAQFVCSDEQEGSSTADLIVADPTSWILAGTGLRAGDHIHHVMGDESDGVATLSPATTDVVGHSPVTCSGGSATFADTTYYTAPSGAGVFDAGSKAWVCSLTRVCPGDSSGSADPNEIRVTLNVLNRFAAGPAGTVTWTMVSPPHAPSPRFGASSVFDEATGQLILVGGSSGGGETWTWTGTDWKELSPARQPPARYGASLAFDPATGNAVLFGGYAPNVGYLADTWTWNGTTWANASPTIGSVPGPRYGASMAFDSATGQLVMFGGETSGSKLSDTWLWDGVRWSQASPSNNPSARDGASMAYDPGTGQLVMFGGYTSSLLSDTWIWSGANWTSLAPPASPPPRYAGILEFDSAAGRLVLFGGNGSGGNLGDSWTWDGTTWLQVATSTAPSGRYAASAAYDPRTAQLVLFGGDAASALADTWVSPAGVPAAGWVHTAPSSAPSARYGAAMTFDSGTGQELLFGGYDSGGLRSDTYAFADGNWQHVLAAASPAARYWASIAFDPAAGKAVLYGGNDGSADFGDTWAWDGTNWSQLSRTGPPSRYGASMAYDPATGQLLLFGGSAMGTPLGDTWVWRGSTWLQVAPRDSPSPRFGATMSYDPGTAQLVLVAGANGSGGLGDTWTWDGSNWSPAATASGAVARYGAAMAFDWGAGQLVLFGGYRSSGGNLNDTLIWSGTGWSPLSSSSTPAARYAPAAAFDFATGEAVLFGGQGATGSYADTWAWRRSQP